MDPAPANPITQTIGQLTALSGYHDTFKCTDLWEYVAAKKNSYVTGNCHADWKLARTTRDSEPNAGPGQGYWDGGYVNGDFDGCGWMRQQDTMFYSDDDTTSCQSPDREHCEYMYCDASHPDGYIYGSGTDGKSMTLQIPCDEVANYRPWSPTAPAPVTAGAANGITLRSQPQGYSVKVRYLARLPWKGYYFVMAHDEGIASGQGRWVFMPAACFAAQDILSPNP